VELVGYEDNETGIPTSFSSWVVHLIDNIPNLISNIVYGYIFLSAYYWISFVKQDNYKNFIIKSVIVNYILKNFYKITFFQFISNKYENRPIVVILLCVITLIIALTLGKIVHATWFNNTLEKIHLYRTTNENIWDDIIKTGMFLRIYMKDGTSYLGMYRKSESFEREPFILLSRYQEFNKDNRIVKDYFDNTNKFILLNTKDFERIKIDYSQCKE
jgi:hypothetical protein